MKTLNWEDLKSADSKTVLWQSALVAGSIEVALLVALSFQAPRFSLTQNNPTLISPNIEAQIIEFPKEPSLPEETKSLAPPSSTMHLSQVPGKGRSQSNKVFTDEQNLTQAAPILAPTHGAIALFSPYPVIPPYLMNRDLKTYVVIKFLISSQGQCFPQLVGGSGSEELDAIALETAKKWQFQPATKDHKPIDTEVRLRILFEVQ